MFSSWSWSSIKWETFTFFVDFSVNTTEHTQLGQVSPRRSVPVEALMIPLPEAYSIRHMLLVVFSNLISFYDSNAQILKEYGTTHGWQVFLEVQMWKFKCSQQRNVMVQSQTRGMHSQRPSNCSVLVSCPSFSSLIFSQLPVMCSQLAKDRMPSVLTNKIFTEL